MLGRLQILLDTHSDSNNGAVEKPGQRITTENAKEFLRWLLEHGVVVCSAHQYAIQNVATHLYDLHSRTKKQQ